MAHSAKSKVGFELDRRGDLSVGVDLSWRLGALIESGRLPSDTRLPGVRDLAGAAGVNANTARGLYRRLEDEGLAISRHGSGTFVAPKSGSPPPSRSSRRASRPKPSRRESIRASSGAPSTAEAPATTPFLPCRPSARPCAPRSPGSRPPSPRSPEPTPSATPREARSPARTFPRSRSSRASATSCSIASRMRGPPPHGPPSATSAVHAERSFPRSSRTPGERAPPRARSAL